MNLTLEITTYIAINLLFCLFLLKVKNVIPLFVLGLFAFSSVTTFLAVFDSLYPLPIFLATFLLTFMLRYFLPFQYPIQFSIDSKVALIIAFLLLSFLGFQIQQDFTGGQDAISEYLPICRYVATTHHFPQDWRDVDNPYLSLRIAYPPLLTSAGSFLFMATGIQREWIAALVPSIFFIATAMIAFQWCKGKGKRPEILGILLFLSPFFIERSSWFFSESIFVFLATLFFYMLYRFSEESREEYINYAIMAAALCPLCKVTGILFSLFLLFFMIYNRFLTRQRCLIFLAFHVPAILWYGRNFYLFTNPAFPFFNFLTLNPEASMTIDYFWKVHDQVPHQSIKNALLNIATIPLLFFWAVIFPKSREFKNTSFSYQVYFFFCFFLSLWLLVLYRQMRFLMPFYWVAMVWLALSVEEFSARYIEGPRWSSITNNSLYFITCFTMILFLSFLFQRIYLGRIFPDHRSPVKEAVNFLMHKKKVLPKTRMFTDTDHGLTWYGDYTVLHPSLPLFAKDFHDSKSLYVLFQQYGIKYVVNHPWKSPWERVFSEVDGDKIHFQELYRGKGLTIWKLMD